jgi:hypothetical protein
VSVIVRRAIAVALVFSLAAGGVALFTNGVRDLVADAWIVALAGVVLLALFRTARLRATAAPSPLDEALVRMRPRERGTPQIALERDVSLSAANGFHFHVRLRPVLRSFAAHRLRSRYGVELDREPGRARELVAGRAWEAIDPHRPPPEDRLASGPSVAEIAAIVDELEKL